MCALGGAWCGYAVFSTKASLFGVAISLIVALYPRDWLRISALLASCFFLAAFSLTFAKDDYDALVETMPRGNEHFIGIIDDHVKREDGTTLLTARVTRVGTPAPLFMTQLYLRDAAAALPALSGHGIEFRGELLPFLQPLTSSDFNGYHFGLVKNLHARVYIAEADAVSISKQLTSNYFATTRETFRARAQSALTPYEASLLLALLIGDTSLFSPNDKEIFSSIGAQHLLAVSGLQISLLSWLCFLFVFPIVATLVPIRLFHHARAITALITTLCLVWFVGLAHFSPSAVRALLMAICILLPTIIARRIDVFDAFFASGLISLLWAPLLALDYGFLLSYAAVFGLLLAHRFQARLHVSTTSVVVRFTLSLFIFSLAAFLATLPIIAFVFQTVAPLSVVANALLLPLASLMQIPALVFGTLGCLINSDVLIQIAAFFCGVIEIAAHTLSQIIGGSMLLPFLSPTGLLISTCALTAIFFAWLSRQRWVIMLSLVALLWPAYEILHRHDLEVTVIPVGQGDATLFSFDNGQHLLIDAGGAVFKTQDPGAKTVVPTLKRKGVRTLDVLVISHPDPDHLKGAFAVLDAIVVKEIWHSGFRPQHPLTEQLREAAYARNIPLKTTTEIFGTHRFGSSLVQVLAPIGEDYYSELPANDNSLVLKISHGSHALLWPGDIEYFGEQLLVQHAHDLAATILKAPHHGSKTSSSEQFLDAVSPQTVIFSTGRNNRFRFPHNEVVTRLQRRGVQTWNTGEDGEISITFNQQKIVIDAYQPFKEKT